MAMRETTVVLQYNNSQPIAAVILTFELQEEDGRWLGECIELGTAAFANSLPEVRKELMEAVLLQLNEMEALGFVESFLREHKAVSVALNRKSPTLHGASWAEPELAGAR